MWCFSVGGTNSVADVDKGGPKSLLFDKFTMLSLRFLPPRGAKLHWQFQWGAMVGFAPPGSATDCICMHEYMYVCMHACMYCMRIYVCAYIYVYMHVCIYVCMRAYMYICN